MRRKLFMRWIHLILIGILVLGPGTLVNSQDKQGDQYRQLREEILSVYQSSGEQGLRDFVKKQKEKITNQFIVDFAKSGVKNRKEEWLKVCEIIAEGKKDEKILADVLYQTGKYFGYISNKKKAFYYLDKAFPIYLKLNDPMGQGEVYLSKGTIHFYTGDTARAMKMFQKALPFFEKAKSHIGQGNAYHFQGDVYFYAGDNSKAIEMYDKSLLFFEKAGDIIGQGNVYISKGDIFYITGDNSKALKMYDKSLLFYKKANEPLGQGNTNLKKGRIYFRIGENCKALEMYDKALPFFKKAGALIGRGNVYLNKGIVYSRTADNSKVIEMFEKALHFYEKANDPFGQGHLYHYKGNIYEKVGANSKALEMYNKALFFFEKVDSPIGQGNIYLSKGDTYYNIGDKMKALEMYDISLPFYKKVGDPVGLGNVYLRKGIAYHDIGDNLRAIKMCDQAMLLFENVDATIGQGNIYQEKGIIYFKTGNNSKSLEMFDRALLFFRKAGSINLESGTMHCKAKVFAELKKKKKALDLFEKGIVNLEKVRTQTAFSEMKQSLIEKVYKRYQETVLFMLKNKYYEKAFKNAEAMKARVFLDRMVEEFVSLEKGLPPKLKQKRNILVATLSLLSKKIHKTTGKKDEKRLAELKKQYRKVEDEFEELLVKIRLNNPLYASVRYPEPVSLRELQRDILKKGEILVRYFITPKKLYAFLVAKKKFKVVTLEVSEEEINSITERYLLAIKENNVNDMRRFGRALYERLFKPLEKKLKKSPNIIIIPDGHLATIPFGSLIIDEKETGQPVFLLEKYRVKYIQSASILSVLRKHYQRNRESKNFIGFGDPVYDYENFRLSSVPSVSSVAKAPPQAFGDEIKEIHSSRYARAGGILPRLQGSGEEVKAIARLFEKQSQKSAAYIRDKATEENAKVSVMKDFDYIHFACHGLLNDDFQSLVLSQDIPDKKDDGYFTLNEIMNCDYNAKLVVLSACQTGTGKMERAEGVTGLTRAVMYAGTPAVLASLWKVDDTATKELMVAFYKNMLEKNMDKTEALRQAKLELFKNPKFSSPLFWSAFVLYGE